jgi:hypothetical protein
MANIMSLATVKMEVERINKELAEKEKLNNPDPATSPAPSSSSSSE